MKKGKKLHYVQPFFFFFLPQISTSDEPCVEYFCYAKNIYKNPNKSKKITRKFQIVINKETVNDVYFPNY